MYKTHRKYVLFISLVQFLVVEMQWECLRSLRLSLL